MGLFEELCSIALVLRSVRVTSVCWEMTVIRTIFDFFQARRPKHCVARSGCFSRDPKVLAAIVAPSAHPHSRKGSMCEPPQPRIGSLHSLQFRLCRRWRCELIAAAEPNLQPTRLTDGLGMSSGRLGKPGGDLKSEKGMSFLLGVVVRPYLVRRQSNVSIPAGVLQLRPSFCHRQPSTSCTSLVLISPRLLQNGVGDVISATRSFAASTRVCLLRIVVLHDSFCTWSRGPGRARGTRCSAFAQW